MTPQIHPEQERIELRVSSASLKRWRATAAVENLTLSDWIRNRCDEVAVDQELIDEVEKKIKERNSEMWRKRSDSLAKGYGVSNGPFPVSGEAIVSGKASDAEIAAHAKKRTQAIVASKPSKKDGSK